MELAMRFDTLRRRWIARVSDPVTTSPGRSHEKIVTRALTSIFQTNWLDMIPRRATGDGSRAIGILRTELICGAGRPEGEMQGRGFEALEQGGREQRSLARVRRGESSTNTSPLRTAPPSTTGSSHLVVEVPHAGTFPEVETVGLPSLTLRSGM